MKTRRSALRSASPIWVGLLAWLCLALPAYAAMFGYVTNATGIYRVNTQTGATTLLYNGAPFNGSTAVAGAAMRPSDGMLFFTYNNTSNQAIYRWNPLSPATAPVLIGNTGASVPYIHRFGFHPTNGTLYGIDVNPSTTLWTINQTTGAATSVATISGLPINTSGDIAFNPVSGLLYAPIQTSGSSTAIIYQIPILGGAATAAGTITGLSTSAVLNSAMFDSAGTLYIGGDSTNLKSASIAGGAASTPGNMGITPQDFASAPAPSPTLTKSFNPTVVNLSTDSTLTLTLSNAYANAASGAALTDTYPAGLVNGPTPSVTNTCGGTVTATAGGNSLSLSVGTIPAAGSCTITVKVRSASAAAYNNSVAAGALTTIFGFNDTAVSATLNVMQFPSLVHLKTVSIVSDPVNGTTNPKYIPGAIVQYTLRVTNTGPGTAGNVVITDPIPANTDFFAGDLGAAGSGPIQFADGTPTSGLGWTFTSLSSSADSVDFSNDGGTTWTYTPVPVGGYDSSVTAIRLKPSGTMNGAGGGNPYFDLSFRVRVK